MKNQDLFLASLRTRNLKSFFLLLFLFIGSLSYGQQPAQTIVKADKSKMQAIATAKLNHKLVRKNTPRTTLDVSKDLVKKERRKSDAEEVVYGPVQQDKQESPLEALKGKKEDLSKRDMSSKHFINDDGTYTALVGGGPIHYEKNGTWEDISHSITTNNNQEYPHSNTTNLLESYFGASAHLGIMSKTKEGEVREFLNSTMHWEVNGQAINIQNSNNTLATINDNRAYYNNLFGTITAEFTVLSGKRKLNYIIPNAEAFGNIPANAEYLVFSEDIVLPRGWTHTVDNMKGILIKDPSGTTIYAYENPTVYENYHGELSMPEKDNPAAFEIKKIGHTITLFLKVKTSWLQDAARIFPLAIDPTATVYPNDASSWSIRVNSNGTNNTTLRYGFQNTPGGYQYSSFVKYNTSSITNTAIVNTVIGHFNITNARGAWRDHAFVFYNSADPTTTNGLPLFNSANTAYSAGYYNSTTGWKQAPLNAAGIAGVQAGLGTSVNISIRPAGSNWFADEYYTIANHTSANPPYLVIDYSVPGAHCTPVTTTPSQSYINDVRFVGTLNDVSTLNSNYTNGYQDWTGEPKAIQAQGEGINIIADGGGRRGFWKAWIDWNQDGDFDDPGEEVFNSGYSMGTGAVYGFVIPPNLPVGDYTMRIRIGINVFLGDEYYFDFDSCEDFINTAYLGITDYYYGEAEDYEFTVIEKCESYVANTIDNERCGTGTLNLDVTGTGAAGVTGFNFYSAKIGGTLIGSQAAISNAATWTTPSINATTTYWVTATNGTCESTVRVPIRATVNNTPADITFTPAAPILCGEDTIVEVNANSGTIEEFLIDEEFNSGLGVFNNVNNDINTPAVKAITRWQHQTSTLVPTGGDVWKPAIASGINNNGFAMATSDHNATPFETVDNSLTLTTSVNSTAFTSLFLNFDMFYLRYLDDNVIVPGLPEYVNIDVSTNGGGAWTTIETIRADYGYGSNFLNKNIDLIAYINQPDLKIRIRHVSFGETERDWWGDPISYGWLPDGIAVDNIKLFGEKTVTDFEWDIPGVDVYTNPTADIAYTPGTLLQTVYIRPTLLQLRTNPFTINANTGGSAACPSTGHIALINNTKIYEAGNNDWNTNNNWLPNGRPTTDNCVIILNGESTRINTNINGLARNVTVKDGGFLDMRSGSNLTVQDWIEVEPSGEFLIRDSASLIQVTEGTPNTNNNTGNIRMQRTVPGGVGAQQYVYWSSPVENFNVGDINTAASELRWEWNPTIDGEHNGNWIPASGSMSVGKGYIVRGLATPPTPIPANTAQFLGRPSNGIITAPINRGTYTGGPYTATGGGTNQATEIDDNWNLIGNPYPSALSGNAFITENATGANPKINGTIYLWNHTGLPIGNTTDDPFYGNYVYNYLESNYVAYNGSGSNPPLFGGNIAAGQSFFVEMEDGAGVNNTVTFNNSMRVGAPDNSNFLRTTEIERHRVWLDLVNPNNDASTTLVGYITDATNAKDRLYDGHNLSETSMQFYSLIDEDEMAIQGKALPFVDSDTVLLGLVIPQAGNYTIAINSLDGLFDNDSQDIFLEDIYLGIIHNLRGAPYSFNSEIGTFNDRFVLRYTNDALSIPEETVLNGLLISAPKNDYIKVVSSKDLIKTIEVYDILGRVLFTNKNIQQSEVSITELKTDAGTFIVKVTLSNGLQKTQKVVLK